MLAELALTAGKPLNWLLDFIKQNRLAEIKLEMQRCCENPDRLGQLEIDKIDIKHFDRDDLHRELRRRIETTKKTPSDISARNLEIDGLPEIKGSLFSANLAEGKTSYMRSPPDIIRKWYDPSDKTIASMSVGILDAMAEEMRQKGQEELPVDEFLVFGGASSNKYVQEELRDKIQKWTKEKKYDGEISCKFVMQSGNEEGLLKVALGGLAVLAHAHHDRTRIIRREFFMASVALGFTRTGEPHHLLFPPRADTKTKNKVVVFLTRKREVPSKKWIVHSQSMTLWLDRKVSDALHVRGWAREICVYYRDDPSQGGTKLNKQGEKFSGKDLDEFRRMNMEFFIPEDLAQGVRVYGSRSTNKQYITLQCDLYLQFRGTTAHFVVRISHMTGSIDDPEAVRTTREEFEFDTNCEAGFYPIGTKFHRK